MPMPTPAHIGKKGYARTCMPVLPQGHHRHGRAKLYEGAQRGNTKPTKERRTQERGHTPPRGRTTHRKTHKQKLNIHNTHTRLVGSKRRKRAKGNKRYAAACKRVVGKGGATHRHQERKYVTMSCHAAHTREATSARPASPTETRKNKWPLAREWLSRGANGTAVTTALTAQPSFLLH